jgi:outer membrane protein assembly factor BamD
MRKPAFTVVFPLAALLATSPQVTAIDIFGWRPFGGGSNTGVGAPSSREESSAQEELRRGEELENAGKLDSAMKVFRQITRSRDLTTAAPKAQLHIGHILERKGDYTAAFKAYSEYTSRYPRGTDLDSVIESQFNIAKMYLGGKKAKVLGIPVAPSYQRAEEMFAEIVKRAPFHRLAPMAQFNVGQALEKQGKPAEAIASYQDVVKRYPGDPVAADAQYQLGYVQYHEAESGSYDQAARLKARESFEEFVNRNPQSEKVPQARENIKALTGTELKNTMDIAKFYDKTKNYKAAAVYYNEVVRNAPGTSESDQARKRIDELKTIAGPDVLRAGPELAQSGEMALARRRAQARVDVASRPDYNGPFIPLPPLPGEDGRPKMRTTPGIIGPITEPALPTVDPLQDPLGGKPGATDPLLLAPNLPPLPPPVAEGPKPEADPAKKPK